VSEHWVSYTGWTEEFSLRHRGHGGMIIPRNKSSRGGAKTRRKNRKIHYEPCEKED